MVKISKNAHISHANLINGLTLFIWVGFWSSVWVWKSVKPSFSLISDHIDFYYCLILIKILDFYILYFYFWIKLEYNLGNNDIVTIITTSSFNYDIKKDYLLIQF